MQGSLPLVLTFDLMAGTRVEIEELDQMTQRLDVQVTIETGHRNGCWPVMMKGTEGKAGESEESAGERN